MIRLILIAALTWFPLPLAQAHAELVSANPAVNSQLDSLPSQVTLTFDGDLLAIGGEKINVLIVKNAQGIQIDAQDSHVSGATLSVDLKQVSQLGTFIVSWRVVSGDGHPEASSYQFSVVTPSVSAVTASPSPSPTASSPPISKTVGQDFWTRYGVRFMLLIAAAGAVGIWARFERARRKRG